MTVTMTVTVTVTPAKFHRKRLEYDVHRSKVKNLKKKIEDQQASVTGEADQGLQKQKLETTEAELAELEKTFKAQVQRRFKSTKMRK